MRVFGALLLAGLLAGAALAEEAKPVEPEGPDLVNEPELAALIAAGRTAVSSAPMPGLGYASFEMPAFALKGHAWTFDQTRFRLRVVEQKMAKGSPVGHLIGNGVFVINGGFFERDKKGALSPSGLLISGSRMVAPEHDRAGSGIVFAGDGGVGIGYRKRLTDRSRMRDALQVGPILVDPGGRVGVADTNHDRHNRSAICLRPGVFVAVVVQGGLSLFQFASLLAAPEARGGFGCDTAINLDGGPSTQAVFRAGGRMIAIDGWPVQNALVVSVSPE